MAVAGLSDILFDSISLGYELVVVLTAACVSFLFGIDMNPDMLNNRTYVVTTPHVGLYFSQNRKENSRTFRIMVCVA